MRTICVNYSVLNVVEVPDDWTDEEIEKLLLENAPANYNDMEWDYMNSVEN